MHYWFNSTRTFESRFSGSGSLCRRSDDMDERVWGNLPEALVDRIAASLPIPSLFRFRAVCKRFNTNLSCQNFLNNCEDVRSHAPHILLLVERAFGMAGLTYSLVFNKWFKIPFPVLGNLSKFDIVASSGGLLCLKNRESSALLVCNPITRSVRELPPLLSIKTAFEAGMVMDKNRKDYRIIVWRDERPGPVTEIFSSKDNEWVLKSSVAISGDVLSDSGIICGDFFYILVIYEYLSVFAYKIGEDSWHELQAPMPPDILYGYLINHWGNLLLVGGIGKNFPTRGISVWKLNRQQNQWELVLTMPSDLFEILTQNFQRYDAFNCAGQGDHICFIADGHFKALIYDMSKKAWQWSPHFRTGNKHQIVAVEFRLNAVA